jgi:hypothetical protein
MKLRGSMSAAILVATGVNRSKGSKQPELFRVLLGCAQLLCAALSWPLFLHSNAFQCPAPLI